jgi:hypothetical protein
MSSCHKRNSGAPSSGVGDGKSKLFPTRALIEPLESIIGNYQVRLASNAWELKATDSEFPVTAIKKAGYEAVWRGEKSWNGVAILGRPEATSPDTSGWGKVMAPMYKVIALQHSTVKPSSEIPCE